MPDLHVAQLVHTLDIRDGGPARNSFEANLALNSLGTISADLLWFTGAWESSVAESYAASGGGLPSPGPRKVAGRGERRISLSATVSLLKRVDAVIVHGFFLPWIPLVVLLARVHRTPVVLMPHGALTPHELSKKGRKKRLFLATAGRMIFRGVRRFAVASEIEKFDIEARFPGMRADVVGVGTAAPTVAPTPRPIGKPIRLLTLSRLAEKKRIDLAIRAVAALRSREVDVHLTVAGSGPAERDLKRLVEELGVHNAVAFVGTVAGAAKEDLLGDSDIFILPSEDENFGIAVPEASIHGLPVIASANVAAAALLRPPAVTLIEELSPSSIAAAVVEVASKYVPEARLTAHRQATAAFRWDAVARRWEQTLKASHGSARP